MAFSKATREYSWTDDAGCMSADGSGPVGSDDARTPQAGSHDGAPLTVTAALSRAKQALQGVRVTIIGEISEYSSKPGYQAVYFTVSDERSALPCIMWNSAYRNAGITLQKGMLVEMSGVFSLYAAKGRMNFDVKTIAPAGEGELRMRVARLARQLKDEGLMDLSRKRAVPAYPRSIAVVTSPRGKAIHDVLRTLRRRYPLAEVLVAGVPVEGVDAPRHLKEGLERAIEAKADVILLVRGGGSYEDLMPFNDEGLARAIAASPIPIVTGIGHEPDNSIADMVGDVRASTPTAAAEAVAPDLDAVKTYLDNASKQMSQASTHRIDYLSHMVGAFADRPLFTEPVSALFASQQLAIDQAQMRIDRCLPDAISRDAASLDASAARLIVVGRQLHGAQRQEVGQLRNRLERALPATVSRESTCIDALAGRMRTVAPHLLDSECTAMKMNAARLQDLSPLNVLSRGYAIVYDSSERVVGTTGQACAGDKTSVRLSDGWLDCTVDGIRHVADSSDASVDGEFLKTHPVD